MTFKARIIHFVIGLALVALGFLCLNYTNGLGIDHHAKWAAERGLLAPTYEVFIAGAILEAVGAGVFGHAIGRSRQPSRYSAA